MTSFTNLLGGDLKAIIAKSVGDFNGDGIDDLGVFFINKIMHTEMLCVKFMEKDNVTLTDYEKCDFLFFNQGDDKCVVSALAFVARFQQKSCLGIANKTNLIKQKDFYIGDLQFAQAYLMSSGDFNGDGLKDILVKSTISYESFLIYGSKLSKTLLKDNLDGENGFKIISPSLESLQSSPVLNYFAGDINGDGKDDIVINPKPIGFSGGSIASYILYGDNSPTPPTLDIENLSSSNSSKVTITSINFPFELVAGHLPVGDVNNDGISDILVYYMWPAFVDNFFIIYGGKNIKNEIVVNPIDNSLNGHVMHRIINKNFITIQSIPIIGDFDNDGRNDIVICVPSSRLPDTMKPGYCKILYGLEEELKINR